MKKILFMGGNHLQASAMKRAAEFGYYTICVDRMDACPGKQFADEFFHISTTDVDSVLRLAKTKNVDGVLSYASDVSAYTAAYVCEQLGLPTNPAESVNILTHKDLFRKFMVSNGYLTPEFHAFTEQREARRYIDSIELPLIIKPVDSAGSKGVTRLDYAVDFEQAFELAKENSRSGKVIVEKFVQREGYQVDGEGFIKDGKIEFFAVMDQHQHPAMNPHVPIGSSYPSIQAPAIQEEAKKLIQSVFDKLDMKFGAFNSEYILDRDGRIYLIEIGPRSGGNGIPDTLKYACGFDTEAASILACVGEKYDEYLKPKCLKPATYYFLHSMCTGYFDRVICTEPIKEKIVSQKLLVKPGDYVHSFRGGMDGVGLMVLSFEDVGDMNEQMDRMWEHIIVNVTQE